MEERSLKVLANDSTFFNRISNTLTKLLIPTKLGLNSVLITLKRNSVLKSFENYKSLETEDENKENAAKNRYEESYALYLESIDKYIMDSVYKKVKNGSASAFEKNAMSEYYNVVHLKDKAYNEYKARKQKFLLDLDYESILQSGKEKTIRKYRELYLEKSDELYKAILKDYSVRLADGVKTKYSSQSEVYASLFSTLDEYIKNILPIKIDLNYSDFSKIKNEYDELDRFDVGKLDEKDFLEKNMILLAISRTLFTHSLPLVAAENCYKKLISDARNLIVATSNENKKEDVYRTLLKVLGNYNEKILSTKVFWENPKERESFKKFWEEYTNANNTDKKEISMLKREIEEIKQDNSIKIAELKKYYKKKLVEFGVIRTLPNKVSSKECRYTGDETIRELIILRG